MQRLLRKQEVYINYLEITCSYVLNAKRITSEGFFELIDHLPVLIHTECDFTN